MIIVSLVGIVTLTVGNRAISSTHVPQDVSPEQIVNKFCQIDYKGARLNGQYEQFANIYDMEKVTGWDSYIIVEGFEIGEITDRGDSTIVQVTFQVLGLIGGGLWQEINQPEYDDMFGGEWSPTISVVVKEAHDGLLIRSMIKPHVSPEAMLERMEEIKSRLNADLIRDWDAFQGISALVAKRRAFIPPIN